jgi:hypothetical protein
MTRVNPAGRTSASGRRMPENASSSRPQPSESAASRSGYATQETISAFS